jgi:hypothetical protein
MLSNSHSVIRLFQEQRHNNKEADYFQVTPYIKKLNVYSEMIFKNDCLKLNYLALRQYDSELDLKKQRCCLLLIYTHTCLYVWSKL